MVISKIDSYGKLGWLTVTVASFWLAWPIGLAVLAYLLASGRVQGWRAELGAPGTWFNQRDQTADRGWTMGWPGFQSTTSGNRAFDEYRKEAIRTLEEEQREFQAFLQRLRQARDKDEFDAFMSEQRKRSPAEPK